MQLSDSWKDVTLLGWPAQGLPMAFPPLQAGWEAAHLVSLSDLEAMYQPGRSTRLLPAAAEERVTRSNGGVRPKYLIATATVGLCD